MSNPSKKSVSIFTAWYHAFHKHSKDILDPTLINNSMSTNTPTSSSQSFPLRLENEIIMINADIKKEESNIISEFTYTPKSSITTISDEIDKLEAYVTATNKYTTQNNAKIAQLNTETAAKVKALNDINTTNASNVAQAQDLIAKLNTVINASSPITPTGTPASNSFVNSIKQ